MDSQGVACRQDGGLSTLRGAWMTWFREIVAGTISGVLTVGALSLFTFTQRDRIHDWLVAQDPSCADTGQLVPLGAGALKADASSAALDPSFGQQPSDAVDGYAGSWWVPQLASPRRDPNDKHTWHVAQLKPQAASRTLVLDLPNARRVRLVCVVNGLGESRPRYLMHGTVASVTVWGDQSAKETQSLQRLPSEQMQEYQEAARDLGMTTRVSLRVDAVGSGETVLSYDPDDCFPEALGTQMDRLSDGETPQRPDDLGCLRAPVPSAGLSEVVVYVEP